RRRAEDGEARDQDEVVPQGGAQHRLLRSARGVRGYLLGHSTVSLGVGALCTVMGSPGAVSSTACSTATAGTWPDSATSSSRKRPRCRSGPRVASRASTANTPVQTSTTSQSQTTSAAALNANTAVQT